MFLAILVVLSRRAPGHDVQEGEVMKEILPSLKTSASQLRGTCPCCDSKTGLSIRQGQKAIVAHCFACRAPGHEILAALGIERDLREPLNKVQRFPDST